MKKGFIVLLSLSFLLLSACSNEKAQDKSKSLTPEQKQAIAAEKKLEEYQKVVKYNENIQKDIDKTLASILDKGKTTVKQVIGTSSLGEKETQWQYTFVNDSKYSFDWIQLNWDEFSKDGSKESTDVTEPIKSIKPGQTFTANVRLSAGTSGKGVDSYQLTKLTGSPAQGTYKDVTIPK